MPRIILLLGVIFSIASLLSSLKSASFIGVAAAPPLNPVEGDTLSDIDGTSVIAHGNYICAIESKHGIEVGGKLFCWSDREDEPNIPDPESPREETFIQIAGGDYFGCGITLDQSVVCWGRFFMENVPGLYKQIDVTTAYFCGIRVDGSLFCWGASEVTRVVPAYPDTVKFKQVSCASGHCCLLDTENYPHCFGITNDKEIHPPFQDDYDVEDESEIEEDLDIDVDIEEKHRIAKGKKLKKFRQISAGRQYTCGITMDRDINCWGEHKALLKKYPRIVKGPFRQIAVGGNGVCAIRGGADNAESSSTEEGEGDISEDEDEEDFDEGGSRKKNKKTKKVAAAADSSSTNSLDGSQVGGGAPNSLVCWGPAANQIPEEDRLLEWDQIKLSDETVCGVSMDSELVCWGLPHIRKLNEKKIIIA